MDLKLPDLGPEIDTATVTKISVNPGDTVALEQTLLEVETEKTTIPIPASAAGRVARVLVKLGEKLRVGTPIVALDGAGTPAAPTPAAPTNGAPSNIAPSNIAPSNIAPSNIAPSNIAPSNIAPSNIAPAKSAAAPAPAPAKPAVAPPPSPAPASAPAASAQREFKLPDFGEGIEVVTISKVPVKVGDTLEPGTTVVEAETEKTSVAVPAEFKGRVAELRVKAGDKLRVGGVIAVLAVEGAAAAPATAAPATPAPKAAAPAVRPAAAMAPAVVAAPAATVSSGPVPAGPATRRLARELAIDLGTVRGSGRGGRITIDDLKDYIRQLPKPGSAPAAGAAGHAGPVLAGGLTVPPLPDFSKFGPVERKPFTTLRKTIARNLTLAWTVAPAVTQHDMADITELEAGRKRFVEANPKLPKVTMTALAVKACVAALRALPQFNSSYDPNAGDNGELILKKYVNIGIAVDTPRGLVVPVIKDADRKTLVQLAEEITTLAGKAREGKLTLDDQRGGTFTITNLGGIGGTYFSPIINYPEVAILGMSRSSTQPVWRDEKFEPRLMMPLSLSYDHRVVDGADGARFIALLSQLFGDPVRLLMEC